MHSNHSSTNDPATGGITSTGVGGVGGAGKFILSQDTRDLRMEGRAVNSTSAGTGIHNQGVSGATSTAATTESSGVAENILLNSNPIGRPLTNSNRTTNSQLEALKRIQESKRCNSMFVKASPSMVGGEGATVGTRKVMNYAQFTES